MQRAIVRTMTFHDICRALWRQKWKSLLFFLVAMSAVTLIIWLQPNVYRSEGKLYLRLGRENATLDASATLGQEAVVSVPLSRDNEINSVVEIIQSRAVLEKVVDAVGAETILGSQGWSRGAAALTPRDKAIARLGKEVAVYPIHKTDIVVVAHEGRSPQLSQTVVAKLIDSYLEEHVRLNRPQGSRDFFVEQASRLRHELTEKEQALRDLKSASGITAPGGQEQILVARLGHLQDAASEAELAAATAETRVKTLRRQLGDLPATQLVSRTTGMTNEGTDTMRGQLYALETKLAEAEARYAEANPRLQEIRQQIAVARKVLKQEESTRTHEVTAPDPAHEGVRLALLQEEPLLAAAQAKSAVLRGQLAELRAEMKSFNENDRRLVALQRDVDLLQTSYRKYATNLEQARIDEAMETQRMSNISVAQAATCDPLPIRPRRMFNLGMGLLVAVLGGLGVGLACERLTPSLRTAEDVERQLGLRVLATIPRMHDPHTLATNGNGRK